MDCGVDKKLQGFQLIAQEKLQAIICSIPGKKDLILEHQLIKPLENVCNASWLKLKGIQRIYKFDGEYVIPRRNNDQVQVFMIRSKLVTFQKVLRHIHEQEALATTPQERQHIAAAIKDFHIICVPSCFSYFQSLLEEEGLYGLVQLHRYNWDFIYLDQGVLSMEIPNIFSSVYLQEDTSLLPSIAHTLRILQMVCGRPDMTLAYGEHACNIVKMMHTLSSGQNSELENSHEFAALIIVDRNKDYASSLLTPAIYAGLLLEVFQSRAGEVEIETESNKILRQKLKIFLTPKYKQQQHQSQKKPPTANSTDKAAHRRAAIIRLNALNDEIYAENRYKHFTQASAAVRTQANAIGLELQKLNDMKLDEMHDYVARKLPKVTELKTKVMRHLNASEKVIEMLAGNFRKLQSLEEDILNNVSRKRLLAQIDELLTTDGQQYNTLRLVCMLHLCAGLSSEETMQFIRNYCNYFGVQHLAAFQQLAKAGLLPTLLEEEKFNKSAAKILSNFPIPKFQQTEFQANANRLKLLLSATNDADALNENITKTNSSTTNVAAASVAGGAACASYVFNGLFIPLIAQLSSFLLKSTTAEDFANKLGIVDNIQLHLPAANTQHTPHTIKSFANGVKQGDFKDIFPLRTKRLFVFVIGGVTYAEIGACDLVARHTGAEIVVGSDCIISGTDLIASAFTS